MLRAMPLIRDAGRWGQVGADRRGYAAGGAGGDRFGLGGRRLVLFAGGLDDEERDGWLERADVFAMPSRSMPGEQGGEGFGIVYLEAAMRGLPTVAGDATAAVDAVLDGVTGVTVGQPRTWPSRMRSRICCSIPSGAHGSATRDVPARSD